MGATFSAWVPVLIFDTGTDAPLFRKGYITVTVLSVVQVSETVLPGLGWRGEKGRADKLCDSY